MFYPNWSIFALQMSPNTRSIFISVSMVTLSVGYDVGALGQKPIQDELRQLQWFGRRTPDQLQRAVQASPGEHPFLSTSET